MVISTCRFPPMQQSVRATFGPTPQITAEQPACHQRHWLGFLFVAQTHLFFVLCIPTIVVLWCKKTAHQVLLGGLSQARRLPLPGEVDRSVTSTIPPDAQLLIGCCARKIKCFNKRAQVLTCAFKALGLNDGLKMMGSV